MRHQLLRLGGKLLGLLVVMFFLSACPSLPKAELTAYHDAVNAARSASLDLMVDAAAAKKRANERQAARRENLIRQSNHPYPSTFSPKEVLGNSSEDPDFKTRTEAWETITRYNEALIALAEGKSPQQVKSSFQALTTNVVKLSTALGATVPPLGAATQLVSTFLELAEKARTRAEFVQAISKGEPIITTMIKRYLVEDTKNFYLARYVTTERTINAAKDTVFPLAMSIQKLAAEHQEPTNEDFRQRKRVIEKRLQEALRQFGIDKINPRLGQLSGSSAPEAPPYTELIHSQLEQQLASIDSEVNVRKTAIEELLRYHSLLTTYVQLLNQVTTGLMRVRRKLEEPADIQRAAKEIFEVALQLRRDFDELRKK